MNNDSLILRFATPGDIPAIHAMVVALASAVGAHQKVTSSVEDLRRHGFSDPPGFYALIAERDAVPVGMCLYFFSFSTWRGTRGIYVQDIYVAESERGSGLARRLIAEAARRAGDQGAQFLRLSVDRENWAARKFYRKIGLRHAANECIYMAFGEEFDALKGPEEAA